MRPLSSARFTLKLEGKRPAKRKFTGASPRRLTIGLCEGSAEQHGHVKRERRYPEDTTNSVLRSQSATELQRPKGGTKTAPLEQSQKRDLGDGPVRIHLHAESSKVAEVPPSKRSMPPHILPARSTPNLDLSTPTAMFVVYDSLDAGKESQSLLGQRLQCVVRNS